jgi:hypothetical protein
MCLCASKRFSYAYQCTAVVKIGVRQVFCGSLMIIQEVEKSNGIKNSMTNSVVAMVLLVILRTKQEVSTT